jgi:hypothetical protein
MSDFQLGLLGVGAAVVAGVLLYNRLQERAVRREAERAFGSKHTDVLAGGVLAGDAPAARQEPTLEGAAAASRGPGIQDDALPDSRADYVINLAPAASAAAAGLLEAWTALEHRFARRVMLAGTDGDGWRRVVPGDAGRFSALQAALQMVSRDGVVAEAELLEFRALAETLAAGIGATVAAPEMRAALDAARELDAVCAEADIQVALHVVGVSPDGLSMEDARFQMQARADGVTLSLDVARTADPGRAFEAMARAAAQLAAAEGGRVVDDNGSAVDERSLAVIAAQVGTVRDALAERGIEPGGPLALRLFA